MTAIESSGGIAGVSVTVSGPQSTAKSASVKWEGISFINNIEYSNDGMQEWRAYGIVCGKFLPWNNFRQASSSPLPHLNKLQIMRAPTFLSKPSKPDNAQSKQQNWRHQQRKKVMKKTVRKETGCFIVQRRSVSSPSSNIRR